MTDLLTVLLLISLLFSAATLLILAARPAYGGLGASIGFNLGALFRFLLGSVALLAVVYITLYFLSLIGGFYESLTCAVVAIPFCEDPLPLPDFLRLPPSSVGAIMGILPLIAVFFAKALQGPPRPYLEPANADYLPAWQRSAHRLSHWLFENAGIIAVLIIEVWMAALRGEAEAADRRLRIAIGLDQDLPPEYLMVARWGAVVIALGLSALMLYLGLMAKNIRLMALRAFTDLKQGAGLVEVIGAVLQLAAAGLLRLWMVFAVAIGRLLLKLQSFGYRLWGALAITLGRGLIKTQNLLYKLGSLLAIALGRSLLKGQDFFYRLWGVMAISFGRIFLLFRTGMRRKTIDLLLPLLVLLGVGWTNASTAPTTYVVLIDMTGSEVGRLPWVNRMVLSWADPSPQRALLRQGDSLVVIPIRSPGSLDPVYSARFNAVYPSNQLERYTYYQRLQEALPQEVDPNPGTGLSESLRAATFYLGDAPGRAVLIIFGNGEDHSPAPIAIEELRGSVEESVVVLLNLGLLERDRWLDFFNEAGAQAVLPYDLPATQALTTPTFRRTLETILAEN